MNKNELVSHVAAETSATRATAERMVRAVFSAIGDALRGTSPLPSPDSGRSSSAAAPRAGVAIRKPGSPSPSRPRRCRRSRRRRPFETRSTDSVAGQAARCRPFVPATPPRRVHPFAIPTRRSARPGSPQLPLRLRQADRRARASRIAWAPDAFYAEGDRTGVGGHSPGRGTFVAERRTRDSVDSSPVRTHAQMRAELESPRARVHWYCPLRIFSNDSPAHGCARVIPNPFPGRLRSHPLPNRTSAFGHAITAPVRNASIHRAVDSR